LAEVVVTGSTTSGMNAVAQGLRLKPGDRILATNHEHSGGILCWKYFEKYYGAAIDTVSLDSFLMQDEPERGRRDAED